jgi:hypothetical protein
MRNPDPECPGCGRPLPGDPNELAGLEACPHCHGALAVLVLPSFGHGSIVGTAAERTTADDDAACFFHPAKKAIVPCDRCGRFLCGLCDLPVAGEHVCPTCLANVQKLEGVTGIGRPRIRWDIVVWSLVLLPLVACTLFSPITGLVSAGVAIWGLRSPPSRVNRSHAWLTAGLIAGLLEAGGGILVWIGSVSH